MFDFANVCSLTPDDVIILNELLPIAKQAVEASKQILETYRFRIGEEKIVIMSDGYNFEYITRDGVWQARYINQKYDVECSAEGIFEYLKADYLVRNGYVKEFNGNYYTSDGEKAYICRYFKGFLKNTAEAYAETNNTML